ncbi:MAG: hypothetical protein AMXMBFR64_29170 [Myxococcales bacterium]
MNDPKQSVTIAIQLEDETAQGAYANLVLINHTETEFVLDFAFVQPQQPKAKVRSRVVLSPKQASRLIAALTENVGRYEKKFGPIGPVGTPDPSTTLVH